MGACYTRSMLSGALFSFRPASVVQLLGPRSAACPLSLRDVLSAAAGLRAPLPMVQAPTATVARGALVAAKVRRAALGLALPTGIVPESWFREVGRVADELAAGLPIFLSAEVTLEGEGPMQVERAVKEAWRLAEAGLTHLAIDARAVSAPERGRLVAEVAAPALERGLCLDCVLPPDGAAPAARSAAALLDDLARRNAAPDVVSVRCRAPIDAEAARGQLGQLARLCAALQGVPLVRRGPVSAPLLSLLAGSPVRICEDGGAAAASASPLGTAGEEAGAADAGDRLEARAFAQVMDFLEALGATGSAPAIARALERRLAEG